MQVRVGAISTSAGNAPAAAGYDGHMATTTTHITTHQAADLLLVRRATVAEYLRRGWLRGRRIGRGWRIEASSVETLLKCGPPASMGRIS